MRGREGLGCGGRRRPGHSASLSLPVLRQPLLSRHHRPRTACRCFFPGCLWHFQMPCLLSAALCAFRSLPSFKESTPGCTGRANAAAPWCLLLFITLFHTPACPLLLARHFFSLPDVGCLHLIWRCLQRSAPLRGDFSATPILKCIDLFFSLSPEVLT